ncbi:MAG: DUF4332 domain-containing protein [Acidimicrobiia bacterium]|nr:DUF4332 domain-containing protein [Acidimicrobiia bacterium]MYB78557.1 DUF4332 domain-containing protein [Acidimicrobiia bacterium]
MPTIGQVAGMDHLSAARLRRVGIKTSHAFLKKARGEERLLSLSEATGIDRTTLWNLAASADLMRLEGMGGAYCGLLRAAGIHSVSQLGRMSSEEVTRALVTVNHNRRIVRRLPSPREVEVWVSQASDPGFADSE